MLLFLSFSLFWIVLYLPLGSQHSKVKHLAFSFSFERCIILPLWHFLTPVFGQSKGTEQDCENYSPVALLRIPEDSLQHALAFYLPIYFIPSLVLRCRYWSLTLELSTFARKKGGSKTLILNPLYNSSGTIFVLFVSPLSRVVQF